VTAIAVIVGIAAFHMRPGLPPAKWGYTGGSEVVLVLGFGIFGLRTKHEKRSKVMASIISGFATFQIAVMGYYFGEVINDINGGSNSPAAAALFIFGGVLVVTLMVRWFLRKVIDAKVDERLTKVVNAKVDERLAKVDERLTKVEQATRALTPARLEAEGAMKMAPRELAGGSAGPAWLMSALREWANRSTFASNRKDRHFKR